MKPTAILCDSFKEQMFKAEFEKAGVEVIAVKPYVGPGFKGGILIEVSGSKGQDIINGIVNKVTMFFDNKHRRGN